MFLGAVSEVNLPAPVTSDFTSVETLSQAGPLSHSFLAGKNCELRSDYWCFKPLSLGMMCFAAFKNMKKYNCWFVGKENFFACFFSCHQLSSETFYLLR